MSTPYEDRIAAHADLMDRLPVVETIWRHGGLETVTAHLAQIDIDGGIARRALCGKPLLHPWARPGRLRWADYHEDRPEFAPWYPRMHGAQCCDCRGATTKAAIHVARMAQRAAAR